MPSKYAHHPDHCQSQNAYKLAKRIESYWLDEGYDIRAWIEPVQAAIKSPITGEDSVHTIYQVRSTLVNGLPSRFREELVA